MKSCLHAVIAMAVLKGYWGVVSLRSKFPLVRICRRFRSLRMIVSVTRMSRSIQWAAGRQTPWGAGL